jgi:hypothetical protein
MFRITIHFIRDKHCYIKKLSAAMLLVRGPSFRHQQR